MERVLASGVFLLRRYVIDVLRSISKASILICLDRLGLSYHPGRPFFVARADSRSRSNK